MENLDAQNVATRPTSSQVDFSEHDQHILPIEEISREPEGFIGSGSFGDVYRGVLYGETVAIKILKEQFDVSKMWEQFRQEVGVLKVLSHENVIAFRGVCLDPPCIVTEYCPGGSLYDFIEKNETIFRNPSQSGCEEGSIDSKKMWMKRLELVIGIAHGMYYLHCRKRPIIHRDLMSPNILLKEDGTPKIGGFGLATFKAEKLDFPLNPRWAAPELVLDGEEACPKSDVFSFGIIMWEILTGQHPWADFSIHAIFCQVMQGARPEVSQEEIPGEWTGADQYIRLMQNCWAQEPHDRPSFKEIVQDLSGIVRLV